jgi:hypothetical protein
MRCIELNPVRADIVASPVIKRSIQDSRLDPKISLTHWIVQLTLKPSIGLLRYTVTVWEI